MVLLKSLGFVRKAPLMSKPNFKAIYSEVIEIFLDESGQSTDCQILATEMMME